MTTTILCRVQIPHKNAQHCFRIRHEPLEESLSSTHDNPIWEPAAFPFAVYRGTKRINAFPTFKAAMACITDSL